MPLSDFSFPDEFGFVFAGLLATNVANMYLTINVAMARKKFGITYPDLYASEKHIDNKKCKAEDVVTFNCIQRAHQNTLEGINGVRLLGVMNGFLLPKYSGILLIIYSVGRVIYGWGYANGGPKGRRAGSILSHLGDLPLLIMTIYHTCVLFGWA